MSALGTNRSAPRRRIFRVVAAVVLVIAVLFAGLYGWAWLNLDSSGVARALIWAESDVDDHMRFPARTIAAADAPFRYPTGPGYPDGLPPDILPEGDLEPMLEANRTTAFIVIADDRLIYERYFNGYDHDSIETSFSMAKSFNSALVGRAISDGFIASVDDPVTKYVPELLERDERFARITLRHLLSMSSGLAYAETGLPWGDDASTYYAADLRRLALERSEIVEPPGQRFLYNNYNPLLIGMVLERATGRPVATYLSETIWQPLGAEADATWSLDSERSGFEKMESGINARTIDFAKLGSLYLNRGLWRGQRILPAAWVDASTRYATDDDPAPEYQYGWWTWRDPELGDYFAAIGKYDEVVFVFPRQRLVVVRQGTDSGDVDWPATIAAIARRLAAHEQPR